MDGTDADFIPSGEAADAAPVALMLARFSQAVDLKRPKAIASLFAPDGLFQPGDTPIVGREAIEAFYESRQTDPRRRTRHIWNNLMVSPIEPGRARYTAVLTNYAFEPTISEAAVQVRIGNVWGVCTGEHPGAWRFASHVYERVYAAAMPLTAAPLPLEKD